VVQCPPRPRSSIYGQAEGRPLAEEDPLNQKARHPCRLGGARQRYRAASIDGAGNLWVEIAHRVVGDRSEVHHAVETIEVAPRQRSHITVDLAIGLRNLLPAAACEQIEVAADDVMPGLL
jgi:hypothetical protein